MVTISALFYERNNLLLKKADIDAKKYDMENCTAGDYTIRINFMKSLHADG